MPSQRAMRPAKMANNIRVFFIGIDFNGQKYDYYFVLKLSEEQYSSIFSDKVYLLTFLHEPKRMLYAYPGLGVLLVF